MSPIRKGLVLALLPMLLWACGKEEPTVAVKAPAAAPLAETPVLDRKSVV